MKNIMDSLPSKIVQTITYSIDTIILTILSSRTTVITSNKTLVQKRAYGGTRVKHGQTFDECNLSRVGVTLYAWMHNKDPVTDYNDVSSDKSLRNEIMIQSMAIQILKCLVMISYLTDDVSLTCQFNIFQRFDQRCKKFVQKNISCLEV